VFWFSPHRLSGTFFILTGIHRYIVINVLRTSYESPASLVRFWSNLNFLDKHLKNPQMSNFRKIRPVGTELFHPARQTDKQAEKRAGGWTDRQADGQTEGRTDTHDEVSSLRNFANLQILR
jgi:hypothetical protein